MLWLQTTKETTSITPPSHSPTLHTLLRVPSLPFLVCCCCHYPWITTKCFPYYLLLVPTAVIERNHHFLSSKTLRSYEYCCYAYIACNHHRFLLICLCVSLSVPNPSSYSLSAPYRKLCLPPAHLHYIPPPTSPCPPPILPYIQDPSNLPVLISVPCYSACFLGYPHLDY